jgi:DNA-binding transcriptional LysR family regulator
LTRFQRQYPEIEVVLFEGTMHEVGEWIESSIIDVGFVLLPAKGVDGKLISAGTLITTDEQCVLAPKVDETLITTDELCVLVPLEHHLHERHSVTQRELREEGFILEKTHCMLQFMKLAGFESSRIRIRYQVSDSATILAMVREGLGVTLIPRMKLPKKLEGTVALPLDPPQRIQIGLATRSQELASRGAKLFIQTAMSWAQEQTAQLSHPS